MKARQRVKLTGPNRPIGSIHHHAQQSSPTNQATAPSRKPAKSQRPPQHTGTRTHAPEPRPHQDTNNPSLIPNDHLVLGRPGGHGGETAPDPIPNSAVKTPSAYDTAPQGAGKSVAARSSKHQHTHQGKLAKQAAQTSLQKQAAVASLQNKPPGELAKQAAVASLQKQAAGNAGWSSPVARQAHNLKVIGSNPIPATKPQIQPRTCSPGRVMRRGGTVTGCHTCLV